MEDKLAPQGDQLQLVNEKLRRKDDELTSSKVSYASKLAVIKSKFDEAHAHLRTELDEKGHSVTAFDRYYRKLEDIQNFQKSNGAAMEKKLEERLKALSQQLKQQARRSATPVHREAPEDTSAL